MTGRGPLKAQSLKILRRRGIPVTTILDVGVLTGTPELIDAFPDKHHVLFEPVEEYHPQIRATYRRLDVRIEGIAIGNCEGIAAFSVEGFEGKTDLVRASLIAEGITGAPGERKVAITTLDKYIWTNALTGPFLLKIDIDGREMDVLEGAKNMLKNCAVVIIECTGDTLAERVRTVMQSGFRLFDVVEPCYYDSAFWQCDVIFIRNDLFEEHFQQLDGSQFKPHLYATFQGYKWPWSRTVKRIADRLRNF
ncbi:FkbM family methyltransferase [Glycocaulis alkaliphilus]|uniref:FkbM family methyltransferase n=1 Tax=Glycocaulis alkaliphilus TaxID=1434191 RepID=UPI000FD8DBBF|nr:FkbM family methyltransferase [Glycocaulis alkaliphilus]GGB71148.1 hypothetical protein GCM10007417_08650 [Glycocaulis alkaliphilus]